MKTENKLKVAIIVFSPSGNTMTTAKLFEQSFLRRNAQVQLINFTARGELSNQGRIEKYLNNTIDPHDVLCIGGPVYAGHLQENVKNIIKALPVPDEKWGSMVVPFISYGGVHSSVALKEAGALLRKRNRKNISGLKIAANHSLTKKFDSVKEEYNAAVGDLMLVKKELNRYLGAIGKS